MGASVMSDQRLPRGDDTIAYRTREGRGPGVVWLGGFRSDMMGTKAEALDEWAASRGQAYLRFDYFAHGQSSGDFRKGNISRWRDDAMAVLDERTEGPQILVGSSMGGWISLLLARARPERVKGLLLIAPAPDFTEDLLWTALPPDVQQQIMSQGEWLQPWGYGEPPCPITRQFIEDGRKNLLLRGPLDVRCPVRILQGMKDPDVPWNHAVRIVDKLPGNPILTLVKEGDHRLSTPEDLARMTAVLDQLLAEVR